MNTEILEAEAKVINAIINDHFACISLPEGFKIDLWTRHNSLTLAVKDTVNRWCDEALRIDAKFRSWSDEPNQLELTFNHGSGGWNKGIKYEDAMDSQITVFNIGKEIGHIIRNNEDTLRDLVDDFIEVQGKISKCYNDNAKAAREVAEAESKVKADEFVKLQGLEKVSYEELMKQLECTEDGIYWKTLHFTKIYATTNGFKLEDCKVEVSHYGKRATFKLDDNRTSRAKLETFVKDTYTAIELKTAGWSAHREFYRTTWTDANDAVEAIVKLNTVTEEN